MPNGEDGEVVYERALRTDLERRIAELASTPDDAFGRIGLPDAILAGVLFVIVPALFAWMFR